MRGYASILLALPILANTGYVACATEGTFEFDAQSGSVPLWTEAPEAEQRDLSQIVSKLRPSIFLVGAAEAGLGTAFVISQEHRLLATNAHVADIMHANGGEMIAIANGDSRIYEVEQAYYHPGVCRTLGGLVVRTSDPGRGDVYPQCPDVAVLRLAEGEALPPAVPLARPEEFDELLAKSIAMMGFPGHDTSWPGIGQKAEATFRQGVVCRCTDFFYDVNVPHTQLQFIQHSMANWFGFSGSPIFLSNGHVIALNNCGHTEQKRGLITSLSYGVRVDCLWELLKEHGLLDKVSLDVDPATIDVERFKRPDPAEKVLNEVRRLVAQARIDLMRNEEIAAVAKCNEALKALPNYVEAYDARCIAYNFYVNHRIKARNAEAKKYYEFALRDAKKAAELEPSSVDHYLDVAVGEINVANVDEPLGSFYRVEDTIKLADKIIAAQGIRPRDRAYAHRVRAFASAWEAEALRDIEKAIAADPWIPQNYTTLATYWSLHKNQPEQAAAQQQAENLMAALADADQAWLAATSPNDDERNGADALRLAEQACVATDHRWWRALQALAAAQAELGNFDEAVEQASVAEKGAPPEDAELISKQRRAYARGEPWRDAG